MAIVWKKDTKKVLAKKWSNHERNFRRSISGIGALFIVRILVSHK